MLSSEFIYYAHYPHHYLSHLLFLVQRLSGRHRKERLCCEHTCYGSSVTSTHVRDNCCYTRRSSRHFSSGAGFLEPRLELAVGLESNVQKRCDEQIEQWPVASGELQLDRKRRPRIPDCHRLADVLQLDEPILNRIEYVLHPWFAVPVPMTHPRLGMHVCVVNERRLAGYILFE